MIARAVALWVALASITPEAGDAHRVIAPSWSQSSIDLWEERESLLVLERDASLVVALDTRDGTRLWSRRLASSPQRLQLVRRGDRLDLFVSCDAGEVWLLDPADGSVRERIPAGRSARGFDVVGGRYLVTALYALHQLSVWDLHERRELRRIRVHEFPTAVRAAQQDSVWVAHFFDGRMERVNVVTGETIARLSADRAANQVVAFLARDRLYVPYTASNDDQDDPHLAGAVLPMIRIVAPDSDRRLSLSLIDRPVNGPEAVALIRNETALISVNSRSNDLSVIDLAKGLTIAHVEVGKYPQSIAIDRRGTHAYVANAHGHSVSVVELSTFTESARWRTGEETLPPDVARGRELFHDADAEAMALNSWISCSNCHPAGHADGRTWKLPGKPRLRTKDLHGHADTLPGGWMATQDEMQDEELFIRSFFRGTGLAPVPPHPALGQPNAGLSRDLDALSAYVYSLRVPASPHLENGRLSPAARRGKAHFTRLGCAECHPAPTYTISSLQQKTPAGALDVPSLNGIYAQPRLLHDGRASGPGEALRLHGNASALAPAEQDELMAFLLSLPEE